MLWEQCLFVLDANVLLNLYRYSKSTREDLLRILMKVSDRLWIPHQVALEFQDNRLNVIAEQMKRFNEVAKVLDETRTRLHDGLNKLQLRKRHSVIDPDNFLEKVDIAFNEFQNSLEQLRGEQRGISDDDEIRETLDTLLAGKVGPPSSSQEDLEAIYKEAKSRFEHKRPPGFKDWEKTESTLEPYSYGGLVFQREYNDFLLWHQILARASTNPEMKHLIFITDDAKSDWWWIVDGKTIGPCPELIEEITSNTNVGSFYMYNAERFMQFASQYLDIEIDERSIQQVRDIGELGTIKEKATRLKSDRDAEAEKQRFLGSEEGVQAAWAEAKRLYQEFARQAALIRESGWPMHVETKRDQGPARHIDNITSWPYRLKIDWSCHFKNTLRDSSLIIQLLKQDKKERYDEKFEVLREHEYRFDILKSGEEGWQQTKGGSEFYRTKELVEMTMHDLLDRLDEEKPGIY